AAAVPPGAKLTLTFADGPVGATADGPVGATPDGVKPARRRGGKPEQETLL
ncbi:MAG: hypothetical protein JWP04_1109, partial [Belnapia sp.]|nr:hypothetical protein [Belnapia sp.]